MAKYYLENKCYLYNPDNLFEEDVCKNYNDNISLTQKNIENLSKNMQSYENWYISENDELVIFTEKFPEAYVGYAVKFKDIKEMLQPWAFELLDNESFDKLGYNYPKE